MLSSLSIRARILLLVFVAAIASAGISASVGYFNAKNALVHQSFAQLTAVRELKAGQVEDYFQLIVDQMITFSKNRMVIEAAAQFSDAFHGLEDELALSPEAAAEWDLKLRLFYQQEFLSRLEPNLPQPPMMADYWPNDTGTRLLQSMYIEQNPFENGSKHLLDRSERGTRYDDLHHLYHPIIREYLERFGYYDIFLVDHETGHIVYSVFKEVDVGTSLRDGPYRDSNIARAFEAAAAANSLQFVRTVDFEPYHPSYNAPASFIASPIFDGEQKVGVLIFQMPVDRINDIMTSHQQWAEVGLGETGETYIVGSDFALRSQSRFLLEDAENFFRVISEMSLPATTVQTMKAINSSIGLLEVRTVGTRAALAGDKGTEVFSDYRGVRVMSSFRPLNIPDVSWAILSEIDEEESLAPVSRLRNIILILLIPLLLGIALVAIAVSRSVTRPLKELSSSAEQLAAGQLDSEIEVEGADEIAALARSFESMRRSLQVLINRQNAAIDALSTPLIPLHDEILAVPLVGDLDVRRIEILRESLVEELHRTRAKIAILDLTGVPTMGDDVAAALIRVAGTARLLGAEIVMTGVQPELADFLSGVDIDFSGIRTERTLQAGTSYALNRISSYHDQGTPESKETT